MDLETNTVKHADFILSYRWNAEYFIKKSEIRPHSQQHKMVKLLDLLIERKEFLLPKNYSDTRFNYIGLENITQKTRQLTRFEPVLGENIKSRSKVFRLGDILYGRLRPTLNKCLLVDENINEGICSGEIFVLQPNIEIVDPNFLAEVLVSPIVSHHVEGLTAGAALPRLQLKEFLQLEIPLPKYQIQTSVSQEIKKARKDAIEKSLQSNHTFKFLSENLATSLTEDHEFTISQLTEFPPRKFNNPLPAGDFLSRRRKS